MSRLYIGTFTSYILVFQLINRAFMHSSESKDNSCSEVRRNILVIGQSPKGAQYIKEIQKHSYLDCEVVGYISITDSRPYPNLPNLGRLDQLVNIVTEHVIDEITVARPLSSDIRLQALLNQCQSMGITITMLLDVHTTEKAQVAMVGNLPVLKFHAASLNESQLMMKHMLDIIGGMVGTVIFGLVFLFLGPIIKLESSGPVIFKQDRVGKNGRVFQVWKFRSMGVDAEAQKAALAGENEMSGHMFKMTNDPRVTRVGAFIRKTSIDELPQFYNVLKGDMSLVGTRPPTVSEVKAYEQYQRRRICITPGITGKWQVSGRSDVVDFEEVLRLDSEYIENWSIWSDIKILFKTIVVVFGRRGSK